MTVRSGFWKIAMARMGAEPRAKSRPDILRKGGDHVRDLDPGAAECCAPDIWPDRRVAVQKTERDWLDAGCWIRPSS